MSETVAPPEAPAAAFQQRFGLFDATMLVAGSMIGSGIFIVSSDVARDVGSTGWLLLLWAATGALTLSGALSYAELASMFPRAGGQYVFLREAYGPLWGFLYGWTCALVIQTGFIAAVAVAFAKYLGVLVPALGTDNVLWRSDDLNLVLAVPVPWLDEPLAFFKREAFTISAGQLVAVAMVFFLTALNARGVDRGRWVQNVFTVAKVLSLALLIGAGLTAAADPVAIEQNRANLWTGLTETAQFDAVSRFAPWAALAGLLVLCGAMVGPLFSSDAWNNVTFIAAEVKNAHRTLPWSLFLGTALVTALYLLANLAYLAALPLRGDRVAAVEQEAKTREAEADMATLDAQRLRAEAQRERLQGEADRLAMRLRTAIKSSDSVEAATIRAQQAAAKERAAAAAAAVAALAREIDAQAERVRHLKAETAFLRGIDDARDDRVATAVLERLSPNLGVPLMALAIMVSTFGCNNGLILMGPRLYYAMARDGLFFRGVGRLNSAAVPAAGLVVQAAWSVLLIFSGSYSELLDYVIFAALLFYILTVAAVFVLRRTRPELPRPYRALGYPVLPGLYICVCAVIMLSLLLVKPVFSWPSFFIVLTGIPVYLLWRLRGRAVDGAASAPPLEHHGKG